MTLGPTATPSPEYARPPLIEVALAVEFLPIDRLGAFQLSALARRWQDRFPIVQEHPPLPANSPIGAATGSPGMLVSIGAPQLRFWLLTESEGRLIQIQRDRIILNWRAANDVDPYPRYHPTLRSEFALAYAELIEFLSDAGFAAPKPAGVEVTYVNAIKYALGWADLSKVLKTQRHLPTRLGTPTATRLNQVWERTGEGGLTSNLTLNVDTWAMAGEAALMSLSARGSAGSRTSAEAVLEVMDTCHDDVVFVFDELTTDESHDEWGRAI